MTLRFARCWVFSAHMRVFPVADSVNDLKQVCPKSTRVAAQTKYAEFKLKNSETGFRAPDGKVQLSLKIYEHP